MTDSIVITGLGTQVGSNTAIENILSAINDKQMLQVGDFNAKEILGRKGLLAKDESTRLAMACVQHALLDAKLISDDKKPLYQPEEIAVVVSSNLGNIDTIAKIIQQLDAEDVKALSMLDAPNASSNIIASTLAIRYQCAGPNLMYCSGAHSGVAALQAGANLIRAGRARKVLVVGVEPYNEYAKALLQKSTKQYTSHDVPLLKHGVAAAIVLESSASALNRQKQAYAKLHEYNYSRKICDVFNNLHPTETIDCYLTPGRYTPVYDDPISALAYQYNFPDKCLDCSVALGECYGALGVMQAVLANHLISQHKQSYKHVLISSGAILGDGVASMRFVSC